MENNNKDSKKKFRLFNFNKDGKGVYEFEDRTPNLKFFFKLFGRKFSSILQVNLLMLLHVLPVVALVFAYFSGNKTPTITDLSFPALYGINRVILTPDVPWMDLSSINMGIPVLSPTFIIVTICVGILWALTFGWQNVGSAYILRGLFRGEPIFVFSDYFYGIKRNFKQGFLMGLLDFLIIGVLAVDFAFFAGNGGTPARNFMYFVIFAMIIIYLIMRTYIYLMLITFDIGIFKAIKNALIFTVLGIKRNVLAVLGILILLVINVALMIWLIPLGIALPLVLPLVYLAATIGFIATYASYPVIYKYMIAPYANKQSDAENNEETE